MREVAALFVRSDSYYKTMSGVDAWDIERDARKWPGGCPLVAHPPCRAWGVLRMMAKPRHDEKALAPWAVAQVRKWGGVLEHPKGSTLWPMLGLPQPGKGDGHGGWTLAVSQHWWGHRAEKQTMLYIVGCAPADVPGIPLQLGPTTHVITQGLLKGQQGWRPRVTNAEREHTPPALAEWLVELARRCRVTQAEAA